LEDQIGASLRALWASSKLLASTAPSPWPAPPETIAWKFPAPLPRRPEASSENCFRAWLDYGADGVWWLTWRKPQGRGTLGGVRAFETQECAERVAVELAGGLPIVWGPLVEP
jgi:hypothetical protein